MVLAVACGVAGYVLASALVTVSVRVAWWREARRQEPVTVADRVHVDACRPREVGRRSAHQTGWWIERHGLLSEWDAHQLALRMTNAVRRRAMYLVR